jgi:hypothetical protein
MAMALQEDGTVMLSAAKHFAAHRERPFAAAQGDTLGEAAVVTVLGPISSSVVFFETA